MGLALGLMLRAEAWLPADVAGGVAAIAARASRAVPFNAGSGFFVNAEGDFVSAHHVIGGCRRPAVETPWGLWPARPVAASATQDIAVVRTDRRPPAHAVFARYPARLGAGSLWIARFASCGGLASRDIVAAEVLAIPRTWQGVLVFESTAAIGPGNSGSPVVDAQGAIAGMLVARAAAHAGTGMAVDGQTLKGFLIGAGVAFETVPESLPLPDGIAGAVAAQAAFPVVCLY